MKFLPLRDFDDVTSALNFETPDCHVIGGCDLYTTKAAGSDKKLYRNIENSLESQYESLLRLSASVSPPNDTGPSPLNLSRSSPFGPLSQVSSRRTFAYLIATLNASHPDYDFSHILRPADFRKERSLKAVINTIDSTLYNLRPSSGMTLQVPSQTSYTTTASAPPTSQAWGPQMWSIIDKEMTLKECTVYCWAPPDEPFEEEEGSIWSLNYFFFNKERKRVAYIYIRGVPVMTHSPRQPANMSKRAGSGYDSGANKRARYWLGDQAANITNDQDTEDLEDVVMWDNGDEGSETDFFDDYSYEADNDSTDDLKEKPRGMSEEIAASMDMDY
ncbi:mitogen-activated protein kinase-like protein MAF1 [Hyaloscypha bicolor E]|uniref:Repressor of RNA polymerase III transcription MAF1 n=1 Tax=Hyaloscypha bicolor E TaxID=1095630 RepID=A0A2J6TS07_9HELO|nr:mitogen-activated protein kinase-like protein MAF1 [Hyaloscypha bicolor E]PMD65804.1 mitogen-activated protein kinase-like protein MAF1 [Hyaloscypha bicolor E]